VNNFRATLVFRASASCSKILNDIKYIFNTVDSRHTVFQGKRELLKNAEWWKIFQYSETFQGELWFSGQAQVAQKPWMIKNISIQWKISGQLCFSGQVQVVQISWMIKNVYSMQLIKATVCFSGQAQVAQKSWMIKNISIPWKISGQLVIFRASATCSKILSDENMYMQYS